MADFSLERELLERDFRAVCGVDEVGRGALFGPVVAGAVILDPGKLDSRMRDSKRLSPRKRELFARGVYSSARAWSIGWCWNDEIDRMNILQATRKAMGDAVAGLQIHPDYVLMDGMEPDFLPVRGTGVIHGDDQCLSIAAASIIAKVFRDHLIMDLDRFFPGYDLAANKGYPTRDHARALSERGITPFHRRSFRKVNGR